VEHRRDITMVELPTRLQQATIHMANWVASVRESPGRFCWACNSTRHANVAATAYILRGLQQMGQYDAVITKEDRRAGIAWVNALALGDGQYYDPVLLDRPSPDWPTTRPWPDPAMQEGINQYAIGVLAGYGVAQTGLFSPYPPPPGWPQLTDGAEQIVAWIKTRPYHENAWSACSHGCRMAIRLLHWYKEGLLPLEPLLAALQFFFDIQDAETGLWGTASQPLHVRINGTFKLFPLLREILDLPVPHAEKIIDRVLAAFVHPDYDQTVGACDEWDNWYVLMALIPLVPAYRREEIRRLAAWRLTRILDLFPKPDGGFSFYPTRCMNNWIGFDMAPLLSQSDAIGLGILTYAIAICINLLGLQEQTGWSGTWPVRPRESEELCRVIREQLVY